MLEIYCPYCNSKVNADKKSIKKNEFLECSSCNKIFKIKIEQQTMIDCPNCRYAFEIDNLDFKNGDLVECAACNKKFYIDKSYEYLKEVVKTSKLTFWQKIRSLFVKDMFSDCSVDRIEEKPNEENLIVDLPAKRRERQCLKEKKT